MGDHYMPYKNAEHDFFLHALAAHQATGEAQTIHVHKRGEACVETLYQSGADEQIVETRGGCYEVLQSREVPGMAKARERMGRVSKVPNEAGTGASTP